MLRLAFWSLLALNLILFAYAQGVLGTARSMDHEPARLKRQFNTAKLTLLTREQAEAAASAPPAPTLPGDANGAPAIVTPAAPSPAAAATPAAAPQAAFACTEIGPFDDTDARRFETRLAALDLGERQSRQAVQAQDVNSWLVNIPPQGGKEGADRKSAELRALGVTNFYVLQGDSPMRYAISLGVFKTEKGAQALLAQLNKQGVHSARITPRGPQTTHYVYRVRALDAATRKRIEGYAQRYDVDVKSCA
ncbi:SPOR domain-containing protein [Massilia sp. TN1-12]|uniref:SPOR domain-containing protein n=1 Tax=Massilia paldalensis TaxID=3377675 RepID=UPI00384F91EA